MIDLLAVTPLDGLDVTIGELRLRETTPGQITWLAPWPGHEQQMSHALQAAHGMHFPAPGESEDSGMARLLWSGRTQALLLGTVPEAMLAEHGAVLDQTEGWAVMELSGDSAPAALARLVPLDLRQSAFSSGRTARTLLGHMNVQITRLENGFEILVMRSMAHTAVQEIQEAMRSVAARNSSPG